MWGGSIITADISPVFSEITPDLDIFTTVRPMSMACIGLRRKSRISCNHEYNTQS